MSPFEKLTEITEVTSQSMKEVGDHAYECGIEVGISRLKGFVIDTYVKNHNIEVYDLITAILNYPNKPESK